MRFIPIPLSVQLLVLSIFFLPSGSHVFLFRLFHTSRPSCVQPSKRIKLFLKLMPCSQLQFGNKHSAPSLKSMGSRGAGEPVWAQGLTFNTLTASYRANDHASVTFFLVLNSPCANYTFLFFTWKANNLANNQGRTAFSLNHFHHEEFK